MSIQTKTSQGAQASASSQSAVRSYSYSRRRWSGFDAWQEHIRRSAGIAGAALSERHDRDLRRAVIAG